MRKATGSSLPSEGEIAFGAVLTTAAALTNIKAVKPACTVRNQQRKL
jgi:hypothetical protein